MGESSICQSVQLVSEAHGNRNGAGTKDDVMNTKQLIESFRNATTVKQYKAALAGARELSGQDQLVVLDAMFAAAEKLGVQRSTGAPLGMTQELSGSVTVTWETACKRPDGSTFKVVESAVLEPTDFGSGWRSRTKDVPEGVVEAVTAAAMADELQCMKPLAPAKKRRILVR